MIRNVHSWVYAVSDTPMYEVPHPLHSGFTTTPHWNCPLIVSGISVAFSLAWFVLPFFLHLMLPPYLEMLPYLSCLFSMNSSWLPLLILFFFPNLSLYTLLFLVFKFWAHSQITPQPEWFPRLFQKLLFWCLSPHISVNKTELQCRWRRNGLFRKKPSMDGSWGMNA